MHKHSIPYLIIIAAIIFNIAQCADFKSQVGQDKYAYEHFFKDGNVGFYCDIGAHDGQSFSNTYFFEKTLGWDGICFEPLPHLFKQLTECRNCIAINACVSSKEGLVPFIHADSCDEMLSGIAATFDKRHLEMVIRDTRAYGGSCNIIRLPSVRLDTILDEYGITIIDFLSLDTEGNELEILQTIDFDTVKIKVLTVENNYSDESLREFMVSKGYIFIDRLHVDDIFYRPDLITYIS